MGAFCCHGNQSLNLICPKTLCSLSPTPVMLHIKFDLGWPAGFRDIQVWKCGRRRTTTKDHCYTISSPCEPSAQVSLKPVNSPPPYLMNKTGIYQICLQVIILWPLSHISGGSNYYGNVPVISHKYHQVECNVISMVGLWSGSAGLLTELWLIKVVVPATNQKVLHQSVFNYNGYRKFVTRPITWDAIDKWNCQGLPWL